MKKRVVTIHINTEDPAGQMIRASVRGLDREGRDVVIDRMHSEGLKFIAWRAMLRRFRAPVEIHFFPRESGAHTVVGLLQAEDARGRKAAVRVKISDLAGNDGKRTRQQARGRREPIPS